jgi:hypothetical protein
MIRARSSALNSNRDVYIGIELFTKLIHSAIDIDRGLVLYRIVRN